MKKPQILVIGYSGTHCTETAFGIAYKVGAEIADCGAILLTGGLDGVMEAASKGAKSKGGLVVGIIPQKRKASANSYNDIVVATGMGHARNFITAYSSDAVIIVGGGVGTLIEASAAYLEAKPIISMIGSGGAADELVDKYIDDRSLVKIIGEKDPRRAVEKALNLIKKSIFFK